MVDQRAVIFDLETVPDLTAARTLLQSNPTASDREVRGELGLRYQKGEEDPYTNFVKTPLHKIACIGALYIERIDGGGWHVSRAGVGHVGVRSEEQLVEGFIDSLAGSPSPQLIGFNSSSFDLPVLRYRAVALQLSVPLIHKGNGRDYWYRFGWDHLDLCDMVSSFGASPKPSLVEMAALCGIPAKTGDLDGSQVESMIAAGRIEDVAAYCETDVFVTYYVFLRVSLAMGGLSLEQFRSSRDDLKRYLQERVEKRTHLAPYLEALNRP